MGKKSLFIIDDEPEFATTLAKRLRLRGYEVAAFSSAAAAADALQRTAPDVVLLDLRLPGTCTVELLMTIRQTVPGVRVILLTGHLDHSLRLEGMRLDSFPYVMKPVDMTELLVRIEGDQAPAAKEA